MMGGAVEKTIKAFVTRTSLSSQTSATAQISFTPSVLGIHVRPTVGSCREERSKVCTDLQAPNHNTELGGPEALGM